MMFLGPKGWTERQWQLFLRQFARYPYTRSWKYTNNGHKHTFFL